MEKNFKRTTVTSLCHTPTVRCTSVIWQGCMFRRTFTCVTSVDEEGDVLFIGGSDEHGVPITIRAKKEGITPQDVVDRYHKIIKDSFEEFGISFDVYGRTTSKVHCETASEFFRTLYDKGEFVEKTSMQYYDEEAHTFLADRYITGECPHCHAEGHTATSARSAARRCLPPT